MDKQKIAFALALVAGGLCIGNFIYESATNHRQDWIILVAGIFILAFGISVHFSKRT